jgi:hypothetical protein
MVAPVGFSETVAFCVVEEIVLMFVRCPVTLHSASVCTLQSPVLETIELRRSSNPVRGQLVCARCKKMFQQLNDPTYIGQAALELRATYVVTKSFQEPASVRARFLSKTLFLNLQSST